MKVDKEIRHRNMCRAKRTNLWKCRTILLEQTKRKVEYACCHFVIYCTFNKETNVKTVECLGVENKPLL